MLPNFHESFLALSLSRNRIVTNILYLVRGLRQLSWQCFLSSHLQCGDYSILHVSLFLLQWGDFPHSCLWDASLKLSSWTEDWVTLHLIFYTIGPQIQRIILYNVCQLQWDSINRHMSHSCPLSALQRGSSLSLVYSSISTIYFPSHTLSPCNLRRYNTHPLIFSFPREGIKTFQMKHCTSDVLHLVFAMWSAVREAKCIFGDHFVAHLHYVWRGDLVLPVACHFKSPSHFYSNRAVCCVLGCYQIQPKVDEQHFVYNLGTLYSSNHIIEIYNSDI